MADGIRLGPGYHRDAQGARIEETVAFARECLAGVEYDTLVGIGLSGGLITAVLAHELGKNAVLVRKQGEKSHSYAQASGLLGHRWVFVDDLIDNGTTHNRARSVIRSMASERGWMTREVGVFLYDKGAAGAYDWHEYDYGFTPVEDSIDISEGEE